MIITRLDDFLFLIEQGRRSRHDMYLFYAIYHCFLFFISFGVFFFYIYNLLLSMYLVYIYDAKEKLGWVWSGLV